MTAFFSLELKKNKLTKTTKTGKTEYQHSQNVSVQVEQAG